MAEIEKLLPKLIRLRHRLHKHAELSGAETKTAEIVSQFIERACPADVVIRGVGGAGLIFVYKGEQDGPTVAFRCELDALPIDEGLNIPHRSRKPHVSHKCGHDGHMAIACGLAATLAGHRPQKGNVALLFQPSEENGLGANAIIEDGRFLEIGPDFVFALHNLPGYPLSRVLVRSGVFSCASAGLILSLNGQTSHAAHPEKGRSPALAVAELIATLSSISTGDESDPDFALITVIHARLGEVAFGTTPGEAQVMATLRAPNDEKLAALRAAVTKQARVIAINHKLEMTLEWRDEFAASVNDAAAVRIVELAAGRVGLNLQKRDAPFRWSEDFGRFTRHFGGALFGLGAGLSQPELHRQDYDFPDALLETGVRLCHEIVQEVQDSAAEESGSAQIIG